MTYRTDYPTAEERAAACDVLMRVAQSYSYAGTIHDAINTMCRAASALAPAVTESALDSCCSDTRPELTARHSRKVDAWDLAALSLALNAIAP